MKEFDKITKVENQRRLQKLTNQYIASFGFFTAQFGVGYHFIYNVEWLGWDLVEPVTYTIS